MKGFIVLTLEEDGTKISAVEGDLSVIEVLNMLQAVSQHYIAVISGLLKQQVKEDAASGEEQPKEEGSDG